MKETTDTDKLKAKKSKGSLFSRFKNGGTIFDNDTIRAEGISNAAHRLLGYLCSNKEGWIVYHNVACRHLRWGKQMMTSAIRNLSNEGYIRRTKIRNEAGRWTHFHYEFSQQPVFKNEFWPAPKGRKNLKNSINNNLEKEQEKQVSKSEDYRAGDTRPVKSFGKLIFDGCQAEGAEPEKKRKGNINNLKQFRAQAVQPESDNPDMVFHPLTKLNLPMPKSKALIKALPCQSDKKGASEGSREKQEPKLTLMQQRARAKRFSGSTYQEEKPKVKAGPSKERRYKRTPEHEDLFQWLLGLQILDENGFLNVDDMSYLSHKYKAVQLENAYFHMQHKIEKKGFKARSPLAVFKFLLANEHNARGENCDINAQIAAKFMADLGWHTLEIKEKHVQDRNVSAKDISLNMCPAEFKGSLERLYSSIF